MLIHHFRVVEGRSGIIRVLVTDMIDAKTVRYCTYVEFFVGSVFFWGEFKFTFLRSAGYIECIFWLGYVL